MPPIHVLIKPSSGNCNLRCDYCFYYDTMANRTQPSYGFMTLDTLEKVIQKVLAYAEGECTIAYQGGEPTLSGLDFFKQSIVLQEKYNINKVTIHNALQTNGYGLTKEWAQFFKEHKFLVGVSLDGMPRIHDKYRKTAKGENSFEEVMQTINLFQQEGVDFNILTVVNAKTATSIKKLYPFFKKNGLDYLQFINCLDPIGEEKGGRPYSLTPEAYGHFLMELFDLWYADLQKGAQPYIRQFENYIGILVGVGAESCDMRGVCGMQYVVEADGAVYPCDFYVMDEYRLGSLVTEEIATIDARRREIQFIEASQVYPGKCQRCQYFALCRSGCRRSREEITKEQYFCQSYQMFFGHALERMKQLAWQIKGQRGY